MATQTVIQAIRERHAPHSSRPLGECDACTLLVLLDQARTELLRVQEMASKGQFAPDDVAAAVRRGIGR